MIAAGRRSSQRDLRQAGLRLKSHNHIRGNILACFKNRQVLLFLGFGQEERPEETAQKLRAFAEVRTYVVVHLEGRPGIAFRRPDRGSR